MVQQKETAHGTTNGNSSQYNKRKQLTVQEETAHGTTRGNSSRYNKRKQLTVQQEETAHGTTKEKHCGEEEGTRNFSPPTRTKPKQRWWWWW